LLVTVGEAVKQQQIFFYGNHNTDKRILKDQNWTTPLSCRKTQGSTSRNWVQRWVAENAGGLLLWVRVRPIDDDDDGVCGIAMPIATDDPV